MVTQEAFERAAAKLKTLKERPSNEVQLQLYGLYKQATEGDVHVERPGGFEIRRIAKWDAWAKLKGTPKEVARGEYVRIMEQLAAK